MAANARLIPENAMPLAIPHPPEVRLSLEASRHFRQGLEQLGMGEPQQALVAFQHALRHQPCFADAHVGMGIAHALCSSVYPALDHLQHAIELEPANFHAHFKLTQLYFKLRVPEKGYAQAKLALGCATQWAERQLLAQLLREERARERDGIARPAWKRPFAASALLAGALAVVAALVTVLAYVH